jgi:hypothetical protein
MPKVKDIPPSVCGWTHVHHRSDGQIVGVVPEDSLFEMMVVAVCVQPVQTSVFDKRNETVAATIIVTKVQFSVEIVMKTAIR